MYICYIFFRVLLFSILWKNHRYFIDVIRDSIILSNFELMHNMIYKEFLFRDLIIIVDYHYIMPCKRGSHARTRRKIDVYLPWFIVRRGQTCWKFFFEYRISISSEIRSSNFEITQYDLHLSLHYTYKIRYTDTTQVKCIFAVFFLSNFVIFNFLKGK